MTESVQVLLAAFVWDLKREREKNNWKLLPLFNFGSVSFITIFCSFILWIGIKKNIVCLYHEEEGREILKTYSEEKIQNKEEEEKWWWWKHGEEKEKKRKTIKLLN